MPEASGGEGKNMEHMAVDIAVVAVVFLAAAAAFGGYVSGVFNSYNAFLEWVYSHDWYFINKILAALFSIINIALLVATVIFIKKYFRIKNKPEWETGSGGEEPTDEARIISPLEEVKTNWAHIQELMKSSSESDWNMAVLRADALLDDMLAHLGYEGETIADRLKIVDPRKLTSIEDVWSAHRLRNTIAHDPLEQNTRETISYAVGAYERALKELGMMERDAK